MAFDSPEPAALPGASAQPDTTSQAAAPGPPLTFILVVDDEPSLRALLEVGLRQYGFAVLTAGSGQEALDLYQRHSRDIALALLDVRMPGMDGPQTVRALRTLNHHLLCCFMTGDSAGYSEEELWRLTCTPPIGKPFTLAEVARHLAQVLSDTPVGP